jgi:CubicO group peptidase (beta-lactamase class C family)
MRKLGIGIVLLCVVQLLSACKVGRFIVHNFADITDYTIFPERALSRSTTPFQFYKAQQPRVPKTLEVEGKEIGFETYLAKNNTVAFLIIQHDSILYERYWQQYDSASIVASFSMAKSVTSMLIGCAINDKLIASVNEPITNYIPELKANGFEQVTIEHLLQMTSGLKFNEGYANPFGDVASFYYGRQLRKDMSNMKLKEAPGKTFEYLSGNTQLLGLVLERALKNKTVTQYLQEKLWQPMHMEFDASWSIDRKENGIEKTFCCLNARARDFAKLGRLYLKQGNWNGQQLVPAWWVQQSTKVDTANGSAAYYQYQWWLPTPTGDFMAQGILGQFIYVNPKKDLIIVRLGKSEGKANWWEILAGMGQAY